MNLGIVFHTQKYDIQREEGGERERERDAMQTSLKASKGA